MSDSQSIDPQVSNLAALIENIVEQVLGRKFNNDSTTWMANEPQMNNYYPRISSETTGGADNDVGRQIRSSIEVYSQIGHYLKNPGNYSNSIDLWMNNFFSGLDGLGGMLSAHRNGDPLGGAVSGEQFGLALNSLGIGGANMGKIGGVIGFLAGLFPKRQESWNRPKFRDAKQSYEKSFTVDRGEDNPYDLPESYYFRTGWNPSRRISVNLGNNQFDDHIRNSLTNNYAAQLQRGLVL